MLPIFSSPIPRSRLAVLLALGGLALGGVIVAQQPGAPPDVAATLGGHTEMVYAVAYSPDGKYVVTASFDKTLKLWDAATGKEMKTFSGQAGHQNLVLCAAFSPDGQTIASGSSDNTAK